MNDIAPLPPGHTPKPQLAADTPEEFLALLRALLAWSGKKASQVAMSNSDLPRSTAYNFVRPGNVALPKFEKQVYAFCRGCKLPDAEVELVVAIWNKLRDGEDAVADAEIIDSTSENSSATTPSVPLIGEVQGDVNIIFNVHNPPAPASAPPDRLSKQNRTVSLLIMSLFGGQLLFTAGALHNVAATNPTWKALTNWSTISAALIVSPLLAFALIEAFEAWRDAEPFSYEFWFALRKQILAIMAAAATGYVLSTVSNTALAIVIGVLSLPAYFMAFTLAPDWPHLVAVSRNKKMRRYFLMAPTAFGLVLAGGSFAFGTPVQACAVLGILVIVAAVGPVSLLKFDE